MERTEAGEPIVAFARLQRPEDRSAVVLDRYLRRFKASDRRTPLARFGMALAWLWWPIRLLGWWLVLHLSGFFRSKYIGTTSLTVFSGLGAESLHPISPLTTTLNYGVIDPHGGVDVRIVYDHRVLDGATVARALAELEQILTETLVSELRQSQTARRGVVSRRHLPAAIPVG